MGFGRSQHWGLLWGAGTRRMAASLVLFRAHSGNPKQMAKNTERKLALRVHGRSGGRAGS